MNHPHDLSPVAAYFDRLLDSSRDEQHAVGWRTSYSQDVAFLSLSRMEGLRDGVSVLDVGCGLGALHSFLQRRGVAVQYTGIDISPKMIEAAQKQHPGVRFEVRDILRNPPRERYDFVFCSGALSLRLPHQKEYVCDMIATMFGLCSQGLAFNMLSAYSYIEKPSLQAVATDVVYEWPEEVLRFCKTQSRHVSLAHDTDSGLFSVFVYRHNRGALGRYLEYVRPGKVYDATVRAAIDYHIDLQLWNELHSFLNGIEPCAAISYFRGLTYAAQDDAAGAEQAFREAIAADPSVPWPYIQLGYLFSRQGDVDRAVAAAERAVELAPAEEATHEARVKILTAYRRLPEARQALLAMPAGPLSTTLHSYVTDDTQAALASLDRAIEKTPAYLPAHVARADLLERMGRGQEALAEWELTQRMAPNDRSIASRREALSRRK